MSASLLSTVKISFIKISTIDTLGVQVGTIMLMYIVALAYAASSPMILPFTLAYFIVSWHVLRLLHL